VRVSVMIVSVLLRCAYRIVIVGAAAGLAALAAAGA
jgi:hypothetical protein